RGVGVADSTFKTSKRPPQGPLSRGCSCSEAGPGATSLLRGGSEVGERVDSWRGRRWRPPSAAPLALPDSVEDAVVGGDLVEGGVDTGTTGPALVALERCSLNPPARDAGEVRRHGVEREGEHDLGVLEELGGVSSVPA